MKVILKVDVDKLGKADDVKEVKPGFARNYLFTKDMAVLATEKNLAMLKHEKEVFGKRMSKEEQSLKDIADKLSKSSVNINVKVGESGKLFGSVTKEDIVKAIQNESNMEIDKNDVVLEEPIKETGVYSIPVKIKSKNFLDKVSKVANVKVWVVEDTNK